MKYAASVGGLVALVPPVLWVAFGTPADRSSGASPARRRPPIEPPPAGTRGTPDAPH